MNHYRTDMEGVNSLLQRARALQPGRQAEDLRRAQSEARFLLQAGADPPLRWRSVYGNSGI